MMTKSEWKNWHAANVGLSGRSNDPTTRIKIAKLLLPNDDTNWAIGYLKGWTRPSDKKLIIPSVCTLYACAALRAVYADDLPAVLTFPYCKGPDKGVRDATGDLQEAGKALGIATFGAANIREYPDVGTIDLVDDGSGLNAHAICVVGGEADTGAVDSVAGGKVDGSYIMSDKNLILSPAGVNRLYYASSKEPYYPGTQTPTGRFVITRLSIPLELSMSLLLPLILGGTALLVATKKDSPRGLPVNPPPAQNPPNYTDAYVLLGGFGAAGYQIYGDSKSADAATVIQGVKNAGAILYPDLSNQGVPIVYGKSSDLLGNMHAFVRRLAKPLDWVLAIDSKGKIMYAVTRFTYPAGGYGETYGPPPIALGIPTTS